MSIVRGFIISFSIFCIGFTYILNYVYIIQLVFGLFEFRKIIRGRKFDDTRQYITSRNMMPTSILVPAYNEEETLIDNVHSLLALDYLEFEIIVVNDGSSDRTHEKMLEAFDLEEVHFPIRISIPTQPILGVYKSLAHPKLVFVNKENGGKGDALNVGINISSYPLVASVDADSLLERNSLIKLAREFMDDPTTIAAGGTVRIVNGSQLVNGRIHKQNLPKNIFANFQIVEYMRAFFGGRMSWNSMGSLLIISGAFGLFRKSALIKIGGYRVGTIGEDMEIIVRLHKTFSELKQPYRIAYSLDPICWTQCPESIAGLRSQRRRWQIGLTDTLLRYRGMVMRPKYGKTGLMSLPYYWVFEFLGPIVEMLGYIVIPLTYLFGELSSDYFLLFLCVSLLLGMVLSVGGILLSQLGFGRLLSTKQALKLTLYAILENFGYRQLITIFRMEGVLKYRKQKNAWGKINRKSFSAES